jgi:hypothetical protein
MINDEQIEPDYSYSPSMYLLLIPLSDVIMNSQSLYNYWKETRISFEYKEVQYFTDL